MLPASSQRVPSHTARHIKRKIRQDTERDIACTALQGHEAINERLEALDREWDIERTLEANAATISLIGLALGSTKSRKWYLLPAVVAGFLLQHATQGWCPPVPIFRRFGFRTRTEIDYERYALKAMRGDFRDAPKAPDRGDGESVTRLMDAVKH